MTEAVYTHKQAARCKPVRPFCFLPVQPPFAPAQQRRNDGVKPATQWPSHTVDTHEFQTRCTPQGVLSAVVAVGVHAYPQTLPVQQCYMSPLAPCTAVYTHKPARQLAGQREHAIDVCSLRLRACSGSAVYTYKQLPGPTALRPTPRRGHRQPTPVFIRINTPPNPAPSGVRCVWALQTGERP